MSDSIEEGMPSIPSKFIPDEYIILRDERESYRGEIEFEPRENGAGVIIHGTTPPDYVPVVIKTGANRYRVESIQAGDQRVDLRNRTCTCEEYEMRGWCCCLDWANMVHHRGAAHE